MSAEELTIGILARAHQRAQACVALERGLIACARSILKCFRAGGVKVQTIRFHEQAGFLPEPRRSPGNQRLYTQAHMDLLKFIRHSRALGF